MHVWRQADCFGFPRSNFARFPARAKIPVIVRGVMVTIVSHLQRAIAQFVDADGKINGGRIGIGMTQNFRNDRQWNVFFQQSACKAVTQSVRTMLFALCEQTAFPGT